MKDNEIIKLLNSCLTEPCTEQAYINAIRISLDLINRQQAEIERLNKLVIEKHKENNRLNDYLQYAEAEAVKEFAERLKKEAFEVEEVYVDVVDVETVDDLVKEMVGDTE